MEKIDLTTQKQENTSKKQKTTLATVTLTATPKIREELPQKQSKNSLSHLETISAYKENQNEERKGDRKVETKSKEKVKVKVKEKAKITATGTLDEKGIKKTVPLKKNKADEPEKKVTRARQELKNGVKTEKTTNTPIKGQNPLKIDSTASNSSKIKKSEPVKGTSIKKNSSVMEKEKKKLEERKKVTVQTKKTIKQPHENTKKAKVTVNVGGQITKNINKNNRSSNNNNSNSNSNSKSNCNSNNNRMAEHHKGKKKKAKYISELEATGYTQDILGDFKDIYNGMILTNHNRYIYIMEIFPIPYNDKSVAEQLEILENFKGIFAVTPVLGHLKCIIEKTDIKTIVRRIKEACPNSRGEKMVEIRDDYIHHIESICSEQTINYRYFYIWEYEGNSHGMKSTKIHEIYKQMMLTKQALKDVLVVKGNMVAEPENPTLYTLDILYHLLNRNSYVNETLLSRIMRINADCQVAGVEPTIRDYMAPKGLVFDNKEYMMMDGLYYTWFTIEDIGYPDNIEPDWISLITCTTNMDIDFFIKRLPHDSTKDRLDKKAAWGRVSLKQTNNSNKKEELIDKISTNSYIVSKLKGGDDLYDCATVITLYDSDPDALLELRDQIRNRYHTKHLETEPCHMDCEEYFLMTLPLLKFENSIFKRNKRNFTTTSLRNIYCFTSFSMFDQSRYAAVIGPNLENGMIVSLNKFNTSLYPNPHISILGESGAGKSVLEMALGRRDNIMGVKAYYVLPTKAHDYLDACMDIGGTYVRFTPDSLDIYNIMELFPETSSKISSNDGNKKIHISVVARKVTSLCTWFRILSLLETSERYQLSTIDLNRINTLLMELYEDFGFTKENDSIWENEKKRIKKPMPVLSDWYERMKQDGQLDIFADLLLPFINGNFKNFNNQSNIDITKDTIVFDVEVDDIGEMLHPAIMYMAFDLSSNLIKADPDHFASLYLDEVWKMMMDEIISKNINENIRLLRSYGGSVVTSTQDIIELCDNKNGQAVISNSSIKILLKMEDDEEIKRVSQYIPLSNRDKIFLKSAKQGDMLVICNGNKYRCHLSLSIDELIAYNTDINKKEKYRRLKMQRINMKKKK